jgi:iron complex transport system ATP-binding protein
MPTATVPAAMPPVRLTDVRLVREGRTILSPLSWTVHEDERWIVLGANGSGKTTLIQIAALYLHPSTGTVEVLGETLGRCDVRSPSADRPGLAALAHAAPTAATALDTVMTARTRLEPWWHRYTDEDRAGAAGLDRLGSAATRADGRFALVRRAAASAAGPGVHDRPGLVLLDEPSARLTWAAGRPSSPLADLAGPLSAADGDGHPPRRRDPPGFDHALVLREGRVLAAGPWTRRCGPTCCRRRSV